MTAHAVLIWLTTTVPGGLVAYGAATWLVGEIFRQRTDEQWAGLKALRWPWRAYLYWALVWSGVGSLCRSVGVDGPAIRRWILTVVLAKGLGDKLAGGGAAGAPAPDAGPFGPERKSTLPWPPGAPPPGGP